MRHRDPYAGKKRGTRRYLSITRLPYKVEFMDFVILAAGLGQRLGGPLPKPLTPISASESMLSRLLRQFSDALGTDLTVHVVVGHRAEQVIATQDNISWISNPSYASTNTAASLRIAFDKIGKGPILWANGDLVITDRVALEIVDATRRGDSFIVANKAETGDEEVKYRLDGDGYVQTIGKNIGANPAGEAVGINFVSRAHYFPVVAKLAEASNKAYFEDAVDEAIANGSLQIRPLLVPDNMAIEVDTPSDLQLARALVASEQKFQIA